MIGDYFKKSFFDKGTLIIYFIGYIYCLFQLYLFKDKQYIDVTIVTSNTFCLILNQILLFIIIRRNRNLTSNMDHILIRLNKEMFIGEMIKCILFETIIHLFIIYILPLIVLGMHIYSIEIYIIFLIIILLLFILYQLMELTILFIKGKYIRMIILCLPFILNMTIQLFFMNTLYINLGGL